MDLDRLGRVLVVIGLVTVVAGALFVLLGGLGLGVTAGDTSGPSHPAARATTPTETTRPSR